MLSLLFLICAINALVQTNTAEITGGAYAWPYNPPA